MKGKAKKQTAASSLPRSFVTLGGVDIYPQSIKRETQMQPTESVLFSLLPWGIDNYCSRSIHTILSIMLKCNLTRFHLERSIHQNLFCFIRSLLSSSGILNQYFDKTFFLVPLNVDVPKPKKNLCGYCFLKLSNCRKFRKNYSSLQAPL